MRWWERGILEVYDTGKATGGCLLSAVLTLLWFVLWIGGTAVTVYLIYAAVKVLLRWYPVGD